MPLKKGDIVLVPFPFTDLSQTKLRPVLILWVSPQGQDVTLCFISSQNLTQVSSDELLLQSSDPEFPLTGLKTSSKVRVSRLVTLERKLLRRKLGELGIETLQKLDQTLLHTFQISP